MLFEHMTAYDVEKTVEKGLIAILPLGSIETHGPHMPTGTDSITVYNITKLAAEIQEAVVFPTFNYAYVPENRHFPGTISLTAKTLLVLLEEVCDEIARNGFKKIFIVNGHGGNSNILRVFLRNSLTKKRSYSLYAMVNVRTPLEDILIEISEGRPIGHACEIETSIGLYLFEELIDMNKVEHDAKLGNTQLPLGIETPIDWPAYALELYLGDPRYATIEKGKILVKKLIDFLAYSIGIIKQDNNVPNILDNFYKRAYEG